MKYFSNLYNQNTRHEMNMNFINYKIHASG